MQYLFVMFDAFGSGAFPSMARTMMEHMRVWVEIYMHIVDKHTQAHMHRHTSTHVDDETHASTVW